jgi:hypothetical protein
LKSRGLSIFNPERWLKCTAGTALRLVLQDGPSRDSEFINALYAETSSQFDANVLSESKIIRAIATSKLSSIAIWMPRAT